MIRPAVLAGLSVLLAAWSAEGATVYRRASARPAGAMAVLGGPAAKPAAAIGGPAEPKARLPGGGGSGASKPAHRSRAGAPSVGPIPGPRASTHAAPEAAALPAERDMRGGPASPAAKAKGRAAAR